MPTALPGRVILMQAIHPEKGALWVVAALSGLVNLLMLTGPIFMVNVYDRALPAGSRSTLAILCLLAAGSYCALAATESLRGRLMARIAARFQLRLDRELGEAVLWRGLGAATTALRQGLSHPSLLALCDLPFLPVFIALLAWAHPALGLYAVASALGLVVVALLGRALNRAGPATAADQAAHQFAGAALVGSDTAQVLSMRSNLSDAWLGLRDRATCAATNLAEDHTRLLSLGRGLRLGLQSGILALGALLVLDRQLGAGAMMAASILLGRALAPVDILIAGAQDLSRAHAAWLRISHFPGSEDTPATASAHGDLCVRNLGVGAFGERLSGITFTLGPGRALGIIGASGAGKSTLVRALLGLEDSSGEILWGDHPIGASRTGAVGASLQDTTLFPGSLGQNIARFFPTPVEEALTAAITEASLGELIRLLPHGIATQVDARGAPLSRGQAQRVCWARAAYSDPKLLIFDEPTSAQDAKGSAAFTALVRAAKKRGAMVIICSHRPGALEACDVILHLEEGRQVSCRAAATVLQRGRA